MSHLPVIVGFGGINSAGRGSFHHAYRRIVIDSLNDIDANETYLNLATMMGLLSYENGKYVGDNGEECVIDQVRNRFGENNKKNTLLRKIGKELMNDHIDIKKKVRLQLENNSSVCFTLGKNQLPSLIPENWVITKLTNDRVKIEIMGELEFWLDDRRKSLVQTGGQLPTGFDPGSTYSSQNHPRGLQMTVWGASDAIQSMGIPWEIVRNAVRPEQVGVYAGSAMGQLDSYGGGGYLNAPFLGKRTSSKQVPFSLVEMAADFINAYLIGNLGFTGAQTGACASALYALCAAVKDIQAGRRRVAIVGNAEAPLIPQVIEGFRVMSALAEDAQILELDRHKGSTVPDHSRACRPFGHNCGFTLAESAQFIVLFDDELAIELGAQIQGSVGDIFIDADGFKKSIASPGFGNYITIARALGSARSIFGIDGVRNRSFIQSHGTGTPQNRVSESHGMNEVAKAFGIQNWPVAAIKSYVGHSLGSAAGDQIDSTLGTWKYGLIPGIFSIDEVAEDVFHSNLKLSREHQDVGAKQMDMAFINTKGFGGNNSTGIIIAPHYTEKMLKKKYGEKVFTAYRKKNESVAKRAEMYDQESIKGKSAPIYILGKNVLKGRDFSMTDKSMRIPGFAKEICLEIPDPYPDMNIAD